MKIFLFWLPRLLAILIALSLGAFALDIFSMPAPLLRKIADLMIYLIPTILIILIVLFTWKTSFWGSLLFTLLFITVTLYFRSYKHALNFTIFSLPFLIVALLYTVDFLNGKKR